VATNDASQVIFPTGNSTTCTIHPVHYFALFIIQ